MLLDVSSVLRKIRLGRGKSYRRHSNSVLDLGVEKFDNEVLGLDVEEGRELDDARHYFLVNPNWLVVVERRIPNEHWSDPRVEGGLTQTASRR